MIVIGVKEHQDNLLAAGVKEKIIPRIIRKSLKILAMKWHKKFAPFHFTRDAYFRYSNAYPMKTRKRSPRRPLYVTGTLQRNIMSNTSVRAVSGSKETVRLVMRMGRPAAYTGAFLKAAVFTTMKECGVDYRTAQRMVYSTFAYGAKNVKLFGDRITKVNKTEKKQLAKWLGKIVAGEFERRRAEKAFRRNEQMYKRGVRALSSMWGLEA